MRFNATYPPTPGKHLDHHLSHDGWRVQSMPKLRSERKAFLGWNCGSTRMVREEGRFASLALPRSSQICPRYWSTCEPARAAPKAWSEGGRGPREVLARWLFWGSTVVFLCISMYFFYDFLLILVYVQVRLSGDSPVRPLFCATGP